MVVHKSKCSIIPIMRAKIHIKSDVQVVEIRSIATAVLIENGIKKAKVLNDEKDKTIVNIILDEDEKTLDNMVAVLKRELKNRKEYPQLPEQFTVSDWEEIDSNWIIRNPEVMVWR